MAEKEYIEREEALARKYFSLEKTPDENRRFEAEIKYYLSILPAAADVVEVVRCKDCKHYAGQPDGCMLLRTCVHENFYCEYGEREEIDNG